MFATIKNLIPEPRQAHQPRRYTGRHRRAEQIIAAAPVSPAPGAMTEVALDEASESDEKAETAAA